MLMGNAVQQLSMFKPVLIAAISLLATYLYNRLRYKRFQQYANFPQPSPSLILGHLKNFDDVTRKGHTDRHPDEIFTELIESIGSPPLMLIDLRPINHPMVFISDHEIAEQVAKSSDVFPMSSPKSPLGYMMHLIGATSILAAEGDPWKSLRKRFSPGFAPQHLNTLLPSIISRVPAFIENLDAHVQSGRDFALGPLIVSLSFDIIGAVVMDVELEAQSGKGELVRLYRELLACYNDDKADLPWWIIPGITMKRHRLGKQIDVLVKNMILQKHAEQQRKHEDDTKSRSILSLSLQGTDTLTPELLDMACDQVKTFFFAGHDTTSTMLAWAFYELSLTPKALNAVRAELDDILGPEVDPAKICAQLLGPSGPELVRRMTYINAVIKEALRLHPPAGTGRMSKPGSGFTVRTKTGDEFCLDGLIVYNCHARIHRDPAVYGASAGDFVPERWLTSGGDAASGSIPPSAWRPFERGPRNCIGQEFALIEARIIIAVAARRYDFIKVGLGELELDDAAQPILKDNGQYKTKSLLYQTRQVTSKPVDGMSMRVKLSSKA